MNQPCDTSGSFQIEDITVCNGSVLEDSFEDSQKKKGQCDWNMIDKERVRHKVRFENK